MIRGPPPSLPFYLPQFFAEDTGSSRTVAAEIREMENEKSPKGIDEIVAARRQEIESTLAEMIDIIEKYSLVSQFSFLNGSEGSPGEYLFRRIERDTPEDEHYFKPGMISGSASYSRAPLKLTERLKCTLKRSISSVLFNRSAFCLAR